MAASGITGRGKYDELIDITTPSRLLMTRLAVARQAIRPIRYYGLYNPSRRVDTQEYVQKKTQYAKDMVTRQDKMVFNLRTMKNDMYELDAEVDSLVKDMQKSSRKKKYKALKNPDEYVTKYSLKYSYDDF